MKITAAVLAVFFLFSYPNPTKSRLQGKVIDDQGAVIASARVLVHWDPSGSHVGLDSNLGIKEDVPLTTGKMGEFETDLPPGFYDLFISATAFSPVCQKIRLKEGGHPPVDFKLKADPLVSKELGHEISGRSK
jgi:Carboxypeptidase regulatory-like domain